MNAPQDTKQQILDSSLKFIQKQSYNSYSFADIAKEIGIKKPSIHYHFPSKDNLAIETMKKYHREVKKYIETLQKRKDKTALDKLEKFFKFFRRGVKTGYLCPGLVLSVEYNTLSKEMQDELRSLFTYYVNWLSLVLEEGKQEGIFKFDESSEEKAFFIASATEGAMIFARAFDRHDHYESTVEQIKMTILA